jgi:outer membrane protein, heavy metal efflux system
VLCPFLSESLNLMQSIVPILVILAIPAVSAGDEIVPSTTLDAIVREALQRNPELQFYEAEILAARGERRSAGARANPEVSAQAGVKSVSDEGRSNHGVASGLSIQQTFEWPGRMELRKAIADRQIDLAELGVSNFRAELEAKARAVGYKLLAAQQLSEPAREVAERFRSLREVLVQRASPGLTATLETRIIEATEITLQREASEAEIERQTAIAELNQLRGRDARAPIRIADEEITFASLPATEVLLAAASRNNFELRKKEVELAQQGLKLSLARNERYPAFSVGPFIEHEHAVETEFTAGAGVSIPWPLWNRNAGEVETARAQLQQAHASLAMVQRDVQRRVVEAATRYETKLKEMSAWRADSLHQFREAAEVADRHYRLGAVPISTYVELQKQYLEAVRTLIETKREALDAAQQLQVLTGLKFKTFEIRQTNSK